jgi:hypothetical protein
MMHTAANDSPFEPLAVSDPAFLAWAIRVGLRLRNKAPGAPDDSIERSITMEGAPSPEWAQALAFMLTLAQSNKCKTTTA